MRHFSFHVLFFSYDTLMKPQRCTLGKGHVTKLHRMSMQITLPFWRFRYSLSGILRRSPCPQCEALLFCQSVIKLWMT